MMLPVGHKTTLSRREGAGTGSTAPVGALAGLDGGRWLGPVPRPGIDPVKQRGTGDRPKDDANRGTPHRASGEVAGDGANYGAEEQSPPISMRFSCHTFSVLAEACMETGRA